MIETTDNYAALSTVELRRIVRDKGLAQGAAVASARKVDLIALLEGRGTLPEQALGYNGDGDSLADVLAKALQGRITGSIDEDRVQEMIDKTVRESQSLTPAEVSSLIATELAKFSQPTIVHVEDRRTGEIRNMGAQHECFPTLLMMAQARDKDGHTPPIYLHGPAGTGKTTAARKLAEALGLPFYYNGAIDSEYKLSGFIDAGGVFRSRPFYEAYANGGVYLFDELDSSLPSAVLAFNAALANGHADFPVGSVQRHADCIIVAAGNTCLRGDGSNAGFLRMEMDAAFRDRFIFLAWPIDEKLEEACVPAEYRPWLAKVRRVRNAVAALGVKKIDITPRATFAGMALLAAGMPERAVIDATLRKGLPESQWSQIERSL